MRRWMSWMGQAEAKETHEAMGSWTGSAEVKKTWEMKEEFLVRALDSKTYSHKPQVFPGAHEPRMTAGLSEPQTADLTCSGFHSQEEKLGKTNFSKFKKRDNKTEKRSAANYFVSVSVSVTGFVCGNSRTTKE